MANEILWNEDFSGWVRIANVGSLGVQLNASEGWDIVAYTTSVDFVVWVRKTEENATLFLRAVTKHADLYVPRSLDMENIEWEDQEDGVLNEAEGQTNERLETSGSCGYR